MALSDLITRPLTAPLTGFNEAVQSGAVLAEGAEKLRLANEQLGIEQQKIQSEYLSKGMSALGALSKSRGAARKIIGSTMISYFEKGGMKIPDSTAKLVLSDEEMAVDLANLTSDAQKKYPGNIPLQVAHIEQVLINDPERAKEVVGSLKQQQVIEGQNARIVSQEAARAAAEASKEQWKSSEAAKSEMYKTLTTAQAPISFIRKISKLPAEKAAPLVAGYMSLIGSKEIELNKQIPNNLKDLTQSQRVEVSNALASIKEAKNLFSTDSDKATNMLDDAKLKIDTIIGTIQKHTEKLEPKSKEVERQLKIRTEAEKTWEAIAGKDNIDAVTLINKVNTVLNNPESYSNANAVSTAKELYANIGTGNKSLRQGILNYIDSKTTGSKMAVIQQKLNSLTMNQSIPGPLLDDIKKATAILADYYEPQITAKFEANKGVLSSALNQEQLDQLPGRKIIRPIFGKQKTDQQKSASKVFSRSAYLKSNPKASFEDLQTQENNAIKAGYEVIE